MRRSALPDPIADAGDVRLSDAELSRIVRLVYERSGITLHAGKRALVLARLQKRLRAGGFSSFRDYLAHVERDASGGEITALLDAIATNHTSFFREPQHFEFLRSTVVPLLATGNIRIWSAACSSGTSPASATASRMCDSTSRTASAATAGDRKDRSDRSNTYK